MWSGEIVGARFFPSQCYVTEYNKKNLDFSHAVIILTLDIKPTKNFELESFDVADLFKPAFRVFSLN